MKKKVLAIMLASALSVGTLTACGGSSDSGSTAEETVDATDEAEDTQEEDAEEADFGDLDPGYEAEANASAEGADSSVTYSQYTIIEYAAEEGGDVVALIEKGDDGYYLHFDFFGDEQACQLDADKNNTYDMTGFISKHDMDKAMVEQAESENNWATIQ